MNSRRLIPSRLSMLRRCEENSSTWAIIAGTAWIEAEVRRLDAEKQHKPRSRVPVFLEGRR
jgi:hypothetical protein